MINQLEKLVEDIKMMKFIFEVSKQDRERVETMLFLISKDKESRRSEENVKNHCK